MAWTGIDFAKSKLKMGRNVFASKIMFDKLPVADCLNFLTTPSHPSVGAVTRRPKPSITFFNAKKSSAKPTGSDPGSSAPAPYLLLANFLVFS